MDYETLTLERADGVATLTLNRPESLNAMTARMGVELRDAFAEVRDDVDARVLLITGAGRAFCAGEDIKERPADSSAAKARATAYGRLARGASAPLEFADAFRSMPKPVIAAINGPAVGQGLSLALACDMRIAADNARLGAIWTLRGIPPESAGAYLLTQIVGPAKACELIFGGQIIGADEALAMGLVNHVVPAAELAAPRASVCGGDDGRRAGSDWRREDDGLPSPRDEPGSARAPRLPGPAILLCDG